MPMPMNSSLKYIPSIFYKRQPLQFTYFVTSRCNSRCPFCLAAIAVAAGVLAAFRGRTGLNLDPTLTAEG